MIFLLHHTHEGRIGLCHQDDGANLGDKAIIARLSFAETIGLYDDIHETFETRVARNLARHPDDDGGEE